MQTKDLKGAYLSPQQLRLWRWSQERSYSHVQCVLEITGDLELDVLRLALQHIVDRYEILHTTFTSVPGMELPMQVIGKHVTISCPLIDIEKFSTVAQQASQEGHWHELSLRSFDLEHGPLLHAVVLRLSPRTHMLMLSLHALCADSSTLKHVSTAILQEYCACLQNRGEAEDDDPLQYVNVTAWLNELLQEEAEEQFAYWRKLDLSLLNSMSLPFRGSEESMRRKWNRATQATSELQQVAIPVQTTLQQRLQVLVQHLEVSTEAVLLTAWQLLLWRLTGERSLLIGMLCDGRPYEELADLIGPYARTVPVAVSLTETRAFSWVVQQMQLVSQQSREKQLYFAWDSISIDEQEQSYFPVSFAYESWTPATYGPLTVSLQRQEGWLEPFQLRLHVWQSGELLQLQFAYDISMFSMQQIQYLANMFMQLLEAAIDQPEIPVSSLPLLTPEQQEQQRERLSGSRRARPFEPWHRLVAAQAQRQPQAPALRSGDQLWSYQQVEQQANQLAHRLRERGLRPAGRVALWLPRDGWAIIALLAVLKAGGSYVPLEEQWPVARVQGLVQDLAPTLLLTTRQLGDQLAESSLPVLLLDEERERLGDFPESAPEVEVKSEDVAYVMYTSGSSGTPKGVLVRQGSVSNYTQALCEELRVQAGWHYATVSSLAADLGNTVIFCGLASGGCVHVLPYEQVTDGAAFASYVRTHPLDVLKIVPTHLQALLAVGAGEVVPRERLILGGEALPWSLVQQVQALESTCELYNHYGPTETTIGALVNRLGRVQEIVVPPVEQRGSSVPLGQPIANMQVYVLDEQQQWVPQGVQGELYLAGAGLAAGYEPQESGTGFVQIAVGGRRERMYRTGDIVREREPGEIEFVGRRDGQVKLRGYRIELGEIEEELRRHPAVREAAVQVWKEEGAEGMEGELVGYVVGWKQGEPGEQEVREALLERLPAYEVPRRIVRVEQLPRTSNGKLDRRRLPPPPPREEQKEVEEEEAHTPIEELLQQLWGAVLGIKRVGRRDDFFRLGGHSLLGTQLVARLRPVFGFEVPITWLFETPTVAGLARRLEGAMSQEQESKLPPLMPVSREQRLPLSFAQQRLWFLDQLEPGSRAYIVPIALWLRGPLVAWALHQSLRQIIVRHEVLRTSFGLHEGQPVQVIHSPDLVPLRWVDLSGLPAPLRNGQAQWLAEQEAGCPFDLQQGPLLRLYLLRLCAQEHVLLLTQHHTVSDAWSRTIWLREVRTLYTGMVSGRPQSLPPLPVQYADYALWQRQWLQGEVLQRQLDYWKHQLYGLTPLELPTDHPRPTIQRMSGAALWEALPSELHEGLTRLSQRSGTTLFMTLLAAFQVLLARSSGKTDIAVGTLIANRGHSEIEGLLGFFTNTMVIRSDLSDNPPFSEVLKRVRVAALEAYAHQEVPFEQVVEALDPERDLSRSPLFQVLFHVIHMPPASEGFADLTLAGLTQKSVTAKFDLTLSLVETSEQIVSRIEYNTDLFEQETIQQWLQRWRLLLEALVSAPDVSIMASSLLTEPERCMLLEEWNATREVYPGGCLHTRVEAQVARTPDAIAVQSGDEQLTYVAFNRDANRLAHRLRELGVRSEVAVGLCVQRGVKMAIGVLGIVKAGGGYVPLDPDYPQQRLEWMLGAAGAPVLVGTRRELERFAGASLVQVDLEQELSQESDANPEWEIHEEQLLYLLFTSGSTGTPKGVAMSHKAVGNLIDWQQVHLGLATAARTLQFASLSFDISVNELFATWSSGGRLQLLAEQEQKDGEALVQVMQREAIERVLLPYSALRLLVEASLAMGVFPRDLRQVLSTAEALQVSQGIRTFFAQLPGCELINEYGPSETHVVTAERLTGEIATWLEQPALGRPIANTQLYLLDEQGQPVPRGVRGEIYLGGVSLARGYWQRADLTAERFVPDAFGSEPGGRLYRTGDVGRYDQQGRVHYLGRMDAQVKLRGYRIELGEIEVVLAGCVGVKEVAVGMRTRGEQEQVVAYVVWQPGQRQKLREVQAEVGARLPWYMQPTRLVELDTLPLTGSGKVDRRALERLEMQEEEDSGEEKREARDGIEEMVRQVWKQILGRSEIGREENFFALGGHSLLATQVVTRLRRLVGRAMPVRVLFEQPTIAGLARWVRQELQQGQAWQASPMAAVSRAQRLPLSFAQQRLWFLDQLEPGSSVYALPLAVRIHGKLGLLALEQALREVMQRHESLRTTFPMRGGEPVQQIAPRPLSQLVLLDLSALSVDEREEQARRLALQEIEQPFDLARGPLLRSFLLRLAEQEHVFLLTMHHIVSDGWSMGILVRELTTLYAAELRGEKISLPALPIQYADYAYWQRNWLQGEVLERQLDYWKRQLSGLSPLELPLDHPRPTVQTFRGAKQRVRLSTRLSQELHELSQREGVTLFMTLLAAFQVLLARYSGQRNIAVGTPIANRTREEIEELIGFFINTLVMRSDLSDDPSFTELQARVCGNALEAYAHQDVPFEQVVEALQPERDQSRSPLFQVVFVLQNTPEAEVSLEQFSAQTRDFSVERHTAPSELRMVISESEQRLNTTLEYNTDLFDEATIKRWLSHWQRLLEGIVADPEQRVLALPLLMEAEREQVLVQWNDTRIDQPQERCLHHLFESQAKYTPDAIALVSEENQLTYAALDRRVNQLARYLRAQGVGPDRLVGLYIVRSIEMIVGVLGILKAGGAYVPLDSTYPTERLNFMLEDAGLSIVLTCDALRAQLPSEQVSALCLDADWGTIARQSEERLPRITQPEHLAYVIYTSGSTGRPKGVLIQHQSVCATIMASLRAFEIGGRERVAQCVSLSFDASVQDIFLTLLSGSTLCLVSSDVVTSGVDLASLLVQQAITLLSVTPSHLEILPKADFPALQTLLLGGENCSAQMLSRWGAGRRIFTVYGPTEASIQATTLLRTESYLQGTPIGRPLANVDIYLLDTYGQPVPIGVPGELYIGGDGLARGYLARPDLTAERFVPHPFSEIPGRRLYRTGDLARYHADGIIEFMGRQDEQVKLRGHRIELGEIEAALRQHPQVIQSIVALKGEEAQERQLVAYVVMDKEGSDLANIGTLRSSLKEMLPDYMVPAHFVVLDTLPLTPNGKVDRRALPLPGKQREEPEDSYIAPGDTIEEMLVMIWSDLLDLEQIGVADNFFDLGGHSLLATQVISRIREQVQVELPLQAFFETPTVAGLAERVRQALQQEQRHVASAIVPVSRAQPLPLSFAQQRLWFLNRLEPDSSFYNMSVALRLQGELSVDALRRSWQEVIERHEVLRTTFGIYENEAVQRIVPSWPEEEIFALIDLSDWAQEESANEVQRRIRQEARRIFDLEKGPLVRLRVLKLESKSYVLLATMHHIISDGWSMGIFIKELTTLYNAFIQGQASPLPALPLQYADFSVWQRAWLQGETLEKELAYWRQQLAGMPEVIELPLDHDRPLVQSYRGVRQALVFSAELTQGLRELSQREGTTLFMTLLTAFLGLLWRYSGQEDIVVGTPIANRSRVELEGLIGFFANTLVLRTSLADDPTFRVLLERVRDVTLGAYSHQDVPFEKLVEILQPERKTSYAPLIQALFTLPPGGSNQHEFSGLTIQGEPRESETSIFDLICGVVDDGQELQGRLTYNKELFEPETIQRLLSHWQVVLEHMVSDLDQQIGSFPLLTKDELEQFLNSQWKGTEDDDE